ncbi:unnamed protein product [Echinostoma caproni]|uniref:Uncharacterized protein n=1 Tax=Echinostoma caproni TaxID=27848 RepID=A0A183AAR0_9TREM|nr:unnamed protein product [Echinostoma caproni]
MKVLWPAAFEDVDVRMFLEEIEDVAELAGIRTDRGKLTALRALLKGRARVVLDAARRGPEKMEWATAKYTLIAGFDTPADRQEALRRFKTAQLGVAVPAKLPYESLNSLLLNHLLPTEFQAHERAKLNSMIRADHVSCRDLILQLNKQALGCNYGERLEEHMCDRLMAGINNLTLQRKLLGKKDLTFAEASKISCACGQRFSNVTANVNIASEPKECLYFLDNTTVSLTGSSQVLETSETMNFILPSSSGYTSTKLTNTAYVSYYKTGRTIVVYTDTSGGVKDLALSYAPNKAGVVTVNTVLCALIGIFVTGRFSKI